MDLNSKLPRTEAVVRVIDQNRMSTTWTTVEKAMAEELGRVLAWCLLRDATNQTPPPTPPK